MQENNNAVEEPNLLKKGFSAAIYHYIGKVLSNLFIFLTSVYIIKSLSVEEYGIYNILIAALTFILTFHFGIPKILGRYYPEYYEKKQWVILRKLTYWSLSLRLLVGIVFALILIFFSNFFIRTFKFPPDLAPYLLLFALLVILKMESRLLENFMMALLDYFYNSVFTISYNALRLGAFFFVLSRGYGISGIIWAWLGLEILLFILYLMRNVILLRPLFSRISHKERYERRMPMKRFTRYGGFYFFSGVGGYVLNYSLDNFFISGFLDNIQVGLYSFGARFVTLASHLNPVMFLQAIITTVLVRKYTKEKNRSQLVFAFKLYNKLIFFAVFPMLMGISIFADKIILYLFNRPEYLQSLYIIWSWVIISVFATLILVLAPFIRVLERSEIMMTYVVFAFVNIGLDILLIPRLGVSGALIATGSARIFTFFFQLMFLKRLLDVKYPWKAFLKFGLNIGAMSILLFIFRGAIQNLLSLFFVIAFGATFYLIISFFNKGFSQRDRKILNESIGKKLFVF